MKKMKILIVSDLHSEDEALETLEKMVEENNPNFTLILGDSALNSISYAERMLEITKPEKTLTINGNNETQELQDFFNEKNVSIDQKARKIDGFTFIGFGSSPRGSFNTVNEKTEEEIEEGLEKLFQKTEGEKTILATHAPPYGVLDEEKKIHIGSKAIESIIKKRQPLINFCGHVHGVEGEAKIKNTRVVKVASLMFKKAVIWDSNTMKIEFFGKVR
jgi:Icc-related predicted phosphoesterase